MSGKYELEQVLAQDSELLREAEQLQEAPPDLAEIGDDKNAARKKKKPAAAEDPEPKAEAAAQDNGHEIADALVNL